MNSQLQGRASYFQVQKGNNIMPLEKLTIIHFCVMKGIAIIALSGNRLTKLLLFFSSVVNIASMGDKSMQKVILVYMGVRLYVPELSEADCI